MKISPFVLPSIINKSFTVSNVKHFALNKPYMNRLNFCANKRRYTDDEIQQQKDKLSEIMKKALIQGYPVTGESMSVQLNNMPVNSVITRIKSDENLSLLWDKVKSRTITKYDPSMVDEQNRMLTDILNNYRKQGIKLTIDEISEISGIPSYTVYKRINQSPELNALWKFVQKRNRSTFSQDEINSQYDKIQSALEEALINHTRVNLNKLASEMNITKRLVRHRIESSPKLSNMWYRIHLK